MLKTERGWRQFAERRQKKERHPVVRKMTVLVADCGEYFRINVAGQPYGRTL